MHVHTLGVPRTEVPLERDKTKDPSSGRCLSVHLHIRVQYSLSFVCLVFNEDMYLSLLHLLFRSVVTV